MLERRLSDVFFRTEAAFFYLCGDFPDRDYMLRRPAASTAD